MRTFLAFELEEGVREKVLHMTQRFRSVDNTVRWVRPENTHVTIHFFGEVEGEDIPAIEFIIQNSVQDISPFSVEVRGISTFPSLERAAVIWYGIVNHGQLQTVYTGVRDGLKDKKLVNKLETRPYTPHLTAGRVKGRITPRLIKEIRFHEREAFGDFTVSALVLFKSTLSGRGPFYEKLSIFAL